MVFNQPSSVFNQSEGVKQLRRIKCDQAELEGAKRSSQAIKQSKNDQRVVVKQSRKGKEIKEW